MVHLLNKRADKIKDYQQGVNRSEVKEPWMISLLEY